jgi:hypothetical protein
MTNSHGLCKIRNFHCGKNYFCVLLGYANILSDWYSAFRNIHLSSGISDALKMEVTCCFENAGTYIS